MIDTNRLDYKKDLEEVIYLFCDGLNIQIKHFEKNDGVNFLNEFEFEGQTYKFENSKNCGNALEVKRFENPHEYYVDLSQKLWDIKQDLLKKANKQGKVK